MVWGCCFTSKKPGQLAEIGKGNIRTDVQISEWELKRGRLFPHSHVEG